MLALLCKERERIEKGMARTMRVREKIWLDRDNGNMFGTVKIGMDDSADVNNRKII